MSFFFVVVVLLFNCVWLFATPWTAACQATLLLTLSWTLLKLMSIELIMQSNHLILCYPLLLLLASIFPSIKVFSNELGLCIRWPNYWKFRFSMSPSNEYSGLISFTIDCFDLFAVQGTLKSLLQHHSLKASVRGVVLRLWRNRMGRPLSPPQIHWKNIWTLSKFHKTISECWQRTPGTQKGTPLSSKGGRTKYKDKKTDKRGRDRDLSQEGSLKKERTF